MVYRAIQHAQGRDVAVKLLNTRHSGDPNVGKRFLREARTLCRLNHPNIVTVFEFGQTAAKELYLVMELLKGCTLGELLDVEGFLPPERVVQLVGQACDGMHFAHEAGLVHRDLKPDNLFIMQGAGSAGDFVKVLDFGLAKPNSVGGASLTRTGVICGTPVYSSPEQAQAYPITAQSDVYSLGVVLFEALCGRVPFDDDVPINVLMAHVRDAPPAMSDVNPEASIPPALEQVVRRALAKDPRQRQPDCLTLKAELIKALVAPTGRRVRRVPLARPSAPPSQKRVVDKTANSLTDRRVTEPVKTHRAETVFLDAAAVPPSSTGVAKRWTAAAVAGVVLLLGGVGLALTLDEPAPEAVPIARRAPQLQEAAPIAPLPELEARGELGPAPVQPTRVAPVSVQRVVRASEPLERRRGRAGLASEAAPGWRPARRRWAVLVGPPKCA